MQTHLLTTSHKMLGKLTGSWAVETYGTQGKTKESPRQESLRQCPSTVPAQSRSLQTVICFLCGVWRCAEGGYRVQGSADGHGALLVDTLLTPSVLEFNFTSYFKTILTTLPGLSLKYDKSRQK